MTLVDCSNVIVDISRYENAGLGVFAKHDIKKGAMVEKGVARVIHCDGNEDPFLFTWSEDRTKWAFCSGCAPFYNTSLTPTTKMERDFENNTFVIYANTDIKKGDELTHTYSSLKWRHCFAALNDTFCVLK